MHPSNAASTELAYFSPCPRGLEAVLARELQHFGASDIHPTDGGIGYTGDIALGYTVNLRSRVASRVLLEVFQGSYDDEDDLYRLALDQPWEIWHGPEASLRVDVVGQDARLQSLAFATLRIKDGICDRYRDTCRGERPNIDTRNPIQRVFAFLDHRDVILYRDMTGDALFKRGWRLEKGEAPLRENLAAGLLALAEWHRERPLVDPMCGSGTFLIEAASIAAGIPAGHQRHFAFQRAFDFKEEVWLKLRSRIQAPRLERVPPMLANDLNPDMLQLVTRNLQRAGLGELIGKRFLLQSGDARRVVPLKSSGGMMVANPPYGERLDIEHVTVPGPAGRAPRRLKVENRPEQNDETAIFFKEFASALKSNFANWDAWILTNDLDLPHKLRLNPARKTPVFNGAIACRWFQFKMVAGSNRKPKPTAAQS